MTESQSETGTESVPEIKVILKIATTSKVLKFPMPLDDAKEFMLALHNHVNEYGFKGWRAKGSLLINMRSVNAAWLEPEE